MEIVASVLPPGKYYNQVLSGRSFRDDSNLWSMSIAKDARQTSEFGVLIKRMNDVKSKNISGMKIEKNGKIYETF